MKTTIAKHRFLKSIAKNGHKLAAILGGIFILFLFVASSGEVEKFSKEPEMGSLGELRKYVRIENNPKTDNREPLIPHGLYLGYLTEPVRKYNKDEQYFRDTKDGYCTGDPNRQFPGVGEVTNEYFPPYYLVVVDPRTRCANRENVMALGAGSGLDSSWVAKGPIKLLKERPASEWGNYQKGYLRVVAFKQPIRYNTSSPLNGFTSLKDHYHRVVKESGDRVTYIRPDGSRGVVDKSQTRGVWHIPWDTGNDNFDIRLSGLASLTYGLSGFIAEWTWTIFFLLGGALALIFTRVMSYVEETHAGTRNETSIQLIAGITTISFPVMLFSGWFSGDNYNEGVKVVELYRHVTAALVDEGLGLPRQLNYDVVNALPPTGFFHSIFRFFYLVSLLAFVGSLSAFGYYMYQYWHYLFDQHPATDNVVDHVEGAELDPDEFMDNLTPDVNLDDPAWVVRNRARQARDLKDLYEANADLGEEAIKREQERRGGRNE